MTTTLRRAPEQPTRERSRPSLWLPMVTHVTVNLLFSLLLIASYLAAVS
jgi:membrane protease YdiL (CAAX protease family)